MYKNIVVAGDVGTGTTTLAKNLAGQLGWKVISIGDFFRNYASANKIPLWNKSLVPDEFERSIDNQIIEQMRNGEKTVFDTHYGGWFAREMKNIFKILLVCDRKVATKRMLSRSHTHDETPEEIEKRREGLYAKFKKLYGEDNYENPELFDLVIDTTDTTSEETLNQALRKLNDN